MLKVSGLEAAYDRLQVLWGVDLDIQRGEIVAMVGSNGAGKSTLLKAISGLLPLQAGAILYEEKRLDGEPPDAIVARGIVHVPEGRRLFPGMTARDNLLMGNYAHRKRPAREVEADLDRMYGFFPVLAQRRNQVAGSLSGGEQQMCAIARGLMARPRILMIDELSLGLAPHVVDELVQTLARIRGEGVTILLVEQDVQHALEIADRAYVLETGRITLSGTGPELLADARIREAYLGL